MVTLSVAAKGGTACVGVLPLLATATDLTVAVGAVRWSSAAVRPIVLTLSDVPNGVSVGVGGGAGLVDDV